MEAVKITYDAARISNESLLHVFWRNVDPLDMNGQFCDRGPQYRSVIFYHDDVQRRAAQKSRDNLMRSVRFRRPIATQIVPAAPFARAEPVHLGF